MRPDEHKRKQSNQYKKKHALAVKGPLSNSSSSQKVKPGLSNWDRYEEPLENNEATEADLLGNDFNTILNAGTGVSSFMKLQNEKEWDTQEDFDDLLTIDCKVLADSLQSLSFFERLGLNEKDFDPTLVNWLNEDNGFIDNSKPEKIVFVDQKSFDFSQPKNVKKSNINVAQTEKVIHDKVDCDLLNTLVKNELGSVNEEQITSKEQFQNETILTAKSVTNEEIHIDTSENSDLLKTNKEENPVDELEDWLDSVI